MSVVAKAVLVIPTSFFLVSAQSPEAEFFENKIRPVLAQKCFMCHSSKLAAPMGGLTLDSKSGLQKGGDLGRVVVPGKPGDSRLLEALRYTNTQLQMPPTGKLPDSVVADFERWIAAGAVDPRRDASATPATAPLKGMDIASGRKWWSFQPLTEVTPPKPKNDTWPISRVDRFVLAKLEEKGLEPSARADRRTLIRRAYLDLIGLPPTYEEVEEFVRDRDPESYKRLVDKLLALPAYGERWGRRWMDVARFGEDNSTSEATNPPYQFAWRYRDWIIEAINQDIPFDRFVKMQFAADLMPGTNRQDLRALGYVGAAPVYHKEPRLSQEVLYTFASDDWDERVDAVSRGLLGLSVACARCHDHKFDPIGTKDYYALAGVFASIMRASRPLREDIDSQTEARYLWVSQRLFDLNVITGILANESQQTNPEWAKKKLHDLRAEMAKLLAEMEPFKARYPELHAQIAKYGDGQSKEVAPAVIPDQPNAAAKPNTPAPRGANAARNRRGALVSEEPFVNAIYDAALYVDGKDPFMTEMDIRPGESRELPVFLRGNVATPGEIVPRRFLDVLAKGENTFRNGSGRLELAERIFTDAAPLAARVIVNRVWDWHFGKPVVGTPSDFGTQGDKPSHPELLDDLAARFIANGWSWKWLHREIMLSAAYQQASSPRAEGNRADQMNRLLWRMNPRRLDFEAYRDSILKISGTLDSKMYGPSMEVDADGNNRRTVYARVSRGRPNSLMRLYDFPDAMQTTPGRDLTNTPLQQLFVMNSGFMEANAAALAKSVEKEDTRARIQSLYRKIFARDPDADEVDLGQTYLAREPLSRYVHALLVANEVIFWP